MHTKTVSTGIRLTRLASAVLALAMAMAGSATAADSGAPRNVTSLDQQQWTFLPDDARGLDHAAAAVSLAQGGTAITLPHTWNASDAASTSSTVPYLRGVGWYRLQFDNMQRGASQWLQFDGASIVADVWLNGVKLGQHKGAFTAFRFDVSGLLKPSGNVLLVRVDNSKPVNGTDPTAIAPLSGDFNMSGGLHRGVSLVSTPNAAHFALDDYGSSGIFAGTTALSGDHATIGVKAKLKNDSGADGSYIVEATLLDADGKTVKQSVRQTVELKAHAAAELALDLFIDRAHLWQGLDDPYLYQLMVELKASDGTPLDKVVQDFGIRTMRFDADHGFFLNGKSYPLHGVNMHQDALGKGWAISHADTDEKLDLVKEIGANTIRLAHYPHDKYTYQQADRRGLVVWAESAFVNQSVTEADCAAGVTVAPAAFVDNLKQQTRELIRQNFNHASIGMWSVANEIEMNGVCKDVDTVVPVLKQLHALAKAEDPGRVTTEADLSEDLEAWRMPPTGGHTDTWGINRYIGWYYNFFERIKVLDSHLDQLHAKYPQQPMGVSEYGAGAALSHQTDNVLGGKPGSFNTGQLPVAYQPEGYAAYVHEQNYSILASKPYIWGTYVWNMFDFGSGIRNEGDVRGVNTKGLVTFDRRTRKDPFYFYQANWRKDLAVTHIVGKRYVDRAYPYADIKIYSNADAVTLKVNGRAVGVMTAAQCAWKTCIFPDVKLRAGANSIVATGSHAGKTTNDQTHWNLGADNAANIYIAAGQITTGFKSAAGHRYGSDNFFSGGEARELINQGDTAAKDHTPVKTADPMQYLFVRAGGDFSYNVPLPNGRYTVTLGFAEPDAATVVGGRVFNVDANGVNRIAGLDVLKAAASYRTAITRSFPVTVSGGKLKLDFKAGTGEAMVSNIAIVRR